MVVDGTSTGLRPDLQHIGNSRRFSSLWSEGYSQINLARIIKLMLLLESCVQGFSRCLNAVLNGLRQRVLIIRTIQLTVEQIEEQLVTRIGEKGRKGEGGGEKEREGEGEERREKRREGREERGEEEKKRRRKREEGRGKRRRLTDRQRWCESNG